MDRYTDDELERIVMQYQDMVYRVAVVRTKSTSAADDVFQETFLKLVRLGKRFSCDEHLKAWLLRVTVNCANDYHRSGWQRKVVSYDDGLEKSGSDAEDAQDIWPGIGGFAQTTFDEADEPLRDTVLEAVRQLSPKLMEVTYLFYYEELSVAEIAQSLRIEAGTVKTRLSRARDCLRKELGGLRHG